MASLPPDIRLSPHLYLATNSARDRGGYWGGQSGCRVLRTYSSAAAAVPGAYRAGGPLRADLTYRREAAGDLAGEITGVTEVPGGSSVWC